MVVLVVKTVLIEQTYNDRSGAALIKPQAGLRQVLLCQLGTQSPHPPTHPLPSPIILILLGTSPNLATTLVVFI